MRDSDHDLMARAVSAVTSLVSSEVDLARSQFKRPARRDE